MRPVRPVPGGSRRWPSRTMRSSGCTAPTGEACMPRRYRPTGTRPEVATIRPQPTNLPRNLSCPR
jgi:hypothetical protein